MDKSFMYLVLLLLLSFSVSASDKLILIPQTTNYYNTSDVNQSFLSEFYVPYTGASASLQMGAWNVWSSGIYPTTHASYDIGLYDSEAPRYWNNAYFTGQVNTATVLATGQIKGNQIYANGNTFESYVKATGSNMFHGTGAGNKEFTIANDGAITSLNSVSQLYSLEIPTVGYFLIGDNNYVEPYTYIEDYWYESYSKDQDNWWVMYNDKGDNFNIIERYYDSMFMIGGDSSSNENAINIEPIDRNIGIGELPTEGNKLSILGNSFFNGTVNITGDVTANSLMVEEEIYSKNVVVPHRQYWSNDFLYNQYGYPWIGIAIASGTAGDYTSLMTAEHPGVVYFRSLTANANSGYAYQTRSINILGGGEKTTEIIYLSPAFATNKTTSRLGFMNSYTATAPTVGAYIELIGTTGNNAVASAKTINSVGNTTHATTGSLPVSAWYRCEITVNSDATSINFKITDSPITTTFLDVDIATHIPNTAIASVVNAYTSEASTATSILMGIDFIDYEINRVLNR